MTTVVHVPQTTQNLVISSSCLAEEGKDENTKIKNARTQLLFPVLIKLFDIHRLSVIRNDRQCLTSVANGQYKQGSAL